MDSITKLVAENMKQTDSKLGLELLGLLLEAYMKVESSRLPYLTDKIDQIINSMTAPLFTLDK